MDIIGWIGGNRNYFGRAIAKIEGIGMIGFFDVKPRRHPDSPAADKKHRQDAETLGARCPGEMPVNHGDGHAVATVGSNSGFARLTKKGLARAIFLAGKPPAATSSDFQLD